MPNHDAVPDRQLIDLYEDRQVRDACKGRSEQELRDAVAAHGYCADRVAEYLKSSLWRAVRGS